MSDTDTSRDAVAGFIRVTGRAGTAIWLRSADIHSMNAEDDHTVIRTRHRTSTGALLEWYVADTPQQILGYIAEAERGA
jgi:hypothetical protein